MQAFSSSDLLDVWERAAHLHPLDQGLLILHYAFPEMDFETLADWPLGQRNRALAKVRFALSGPQLSGWVACRQCAEKLEFKLDPHSLTEAQPARETVCVNGHSFRLPTTRDLARVAIESDESTAVMKLLERCCLDADTTESWSLIDLEEIGESLAEADPHAETRLSFQCASCEHEWSESLDIVDFVLTEIDARAKRLLHDIHTLAQAYGWSESEVLRLSERRRSCYLGMVQ